MFVGSDAQKNLAVPSCRFEVPFNIWCDTCGEHIAKGVRFNAEKKQVCLPA
jgi:hypothetical protein